jgi:hypothetical protein
MQKYNLQKKKKSSKTNQNPSGCDDSLTNLKFQHKPIYHLSKITTSKNRTYYYFLGAKIPRSIVYSITNLNTNILAFGRPIRPNKIELGKHLI